MKKTFIVLSSSALLISQLMTATASAMAIANHPVQIAVNKNKKPVSFPDDNFEGDFTIEAQNKTVNAGQVANFALNLKATGATTQLTNVDIKLSLPVDESVTFSQPLDTLKLGGVMPTFNPTTKTLNYHFDQLKTGQVNKTVLHLSTINGAFKPGSVLDVSGALTADSTKGAITAHSTGTTTIEATKNVSLINKFDSIYNNELQSENYHTNPALGDEIKWGLAVSAPKKVEGSIFLKPGSVIKISYHIDDLLEYEGMANDNEPKPTISTDKHTLTWRLTVPSIEDQMKQANGNFFMQDLSLKLKVSDDTASLFKKATNQFTDVQATFNDGESFSWTDLTETQQNAYAGSIMISQSNASTLPPNQGNQGFTGPHYGPIDAYGNTSSKASDKPDISVTDEATLGFSLWQSSLWATSATSDFHSYSIHYKVDPHLNIKNFYTGTFAYRPSSTLGSTTTPLRNQPHYSFNVRYDEDQDDTPSDWSNDLMNNINPNTGEPVLYKDAHKNNWHTLIADVPLGTWLTAEQLHIPKGKHVKEVLLHFHAPKGTIRKEFWGGFGDRTYTTTGDENGLPNFYEVNNDYDLGQNYANSDLSYLENWAPAGMASSKLLHFNMTPEKGYVGHVENTSYTNFWGNDALGKIAIVGSEWHWLNGANKAWAPVAGAQGAEIVKPTEGIDRTVKTGVQFDQLSELPDGSKVIVAGDNTVTAAIGNDEISKNDVPGPMISYVLLPKGVNYVGSLDEEKPNSELVTDNYKSTGQSLVKVTYSADYLQPKQNSNSTFRVSVTEKMTSNPKLKVFSFISSDDYKTPIIKGDPVITDTLGGKDTDNLNGQGTDKPMFYSGRDYHFDKSSALAVGMTVNGSSKDVEINDQGKADFQLNLTNNTDDDLKNMILMDTLPNVDDLSITTNEQRGSEFNMTLNGPITLPESWQNKVSVTYTTSANPKKAGILDKNTIYPASTQKLEDAPNAEDATWLLEKDVTDWSKIKAFKIELNDSATWVSGADMKIKFAMAIPKDAKVTQKAYNSFAFAANNSQVIEPYRLGVHLVTKAVTNPPKVTPPDNGGGDDGSGDNGNNGGDNGSGDQGNNGGNNGSGDQGNNNGSGNQNNNGDTKNPDHNKPDNGKLLPQTDEAKGYLASILGGVILVMLGGIVIYRRKRR